MPSGHSYPFYCLIPFFFTFIFSVSLPSSFFFIHSNWIFFLFLFFRFNFFILQCILVKQPQQRQQQHQHQCYGHTCNIKTYTRKHTKAIGLLIEWYLSAQWFAVNITKYVDCGYIRICWLFVLCAVYVVFFRHFDNKFLSTCKPANAIHHLNMRCCLVFSFVKFFISSLCYDVLAFVYIDHASSSSSNSNITWVAIWLISLCVEIGADAVMRMSN